MDETIWVTITLLILFALVIRGVDFGYAIIFSTTLFLLIVSPNSLLSTLLGALTNSKTIELAIAISLINILGFMMKETKQFDEIVNSFRSFLKTSQIIVIIPALFGLLPIPGGALMSATLLEEFRERVKVRVEILTITNIWYRRVIGFVYPLMPSIIFLSKLTEINIYHIIIYQIPTFLFATIIGHFLVKFDKNDSEEFRKKESIMKVLKNVMPLILPVALSILGVPLFIAIFIGITTCLLQHNKPTFRDILIFLKRGFDISMCLAIIGIMYFIEALEISDVVNSVYPMIESKFQPTIVITLPFIIALLVGSMLASVSISVLLLSPFLHTPHQISLLYVASICGSVVSPLNLSNIVTLKCFKVQYKRFLPKMLLIATLALLFHSLYLLILFFPNF